MNVETVINILVGIVVGRALAMISLLLFEDQIFGFLDRCWNLFRRK